MTPFDAVLMISFGGPQGLADVRPFLENVLRGRRVAPGRIDEVAHHYELFGGVSPLTALTMRQADGLRRAAGGRRGAAAGVRRDAQLAPVPRRTRWREMSRAGIRRAVGLIAAAHRSYSSCTQYKENVAAARATLRERGLADVEVTYVGDWHTHRRVRRGQRRPRAATRSPPCPPALRAAPSWCSPRTASRSAWPSDIRTGSSSRRRRGWWPRGVNASRPARGAARITPPCIRAAADAPRIPGSGLTSASTCAA